MPRQRSVPAYTLHKPTGQARVRINGKDFYLGPHNSPESRELYGRLIAEHAAVPSAEPTVQIGQPVRTVADVLLAYLDFAKGYYVDAKGQPSNQYGCCKTALQVVLDLYASLRATEFGPLKLQTVRQVMVERTIGTKSKTWSRSYVNQSIGRIKRAFRWAASQELVPVDVSTGLATVTGLRKGKSAARESRPILPVPQADIDATMLHLGPVVAAMVELQQLTGCRPGELVILRPCDVDRSRETWCYVPSRHKTENYGSDRRIYLGPKARRVLTPYLLRAGNAFCFSPAESEAKRHKVQREARRTRVQPSQRNRGKAKRKRAPREHYDVGTYRNAIRRACRKAGVPIWHPHRLRHSTATMIRERFDLEGAQNVLGHDDPRITTRYAEKAFGRAAEIMEQIG